MSQEQLRRPEESESIKNEELFSIERNVGNAENEVKKLSLNENINNKNNKSDKQSISQIAGQIASQQKVSASAEAAFKNGGGGGITIGEALEATALTAGQKPVEWSDAAAIQAAEVRATGRTTISPGGVAAAAQSAATLNARIKNDANKTKLADILSDATSKLPADRPATRKDAEGVTGAEMRNDPFLTTHPAGVSASIAAAARLNQQNSNK